MHHIGSLTGLAAKALTKQVGDIRLASTARILTLMTQHPPLSSGERGAIER
jgi:hypothetical protein